MAALDHALDAYRGVSIDQVRHKSMTLTSLFVELVDRQIGCEVLTPREPAQRGSQVSLMLPRAEKLMRALHDEGIVADFRPPDVARFGFSPLYIGYEDVFRSVAAIKAILARL
jgi:kynureninase